MPADPLDRPPAGKAVISVTKPGETTSLSEADWSGLLEHYRQTALLVLASHLCVGTECGSCGQRWPCQAACAAELALEL
jgi:hypothetical protein